MRAGAVRQLSMCASEDTELPTMPLVHVDAAALDADAETRQLYRPCLLIRVIRLASFLGRELGHRVPSRAERAFMISVAHVHGQFPHRYRYRRDITVGD